jgi:hypothetical protein
VASNFEELSDADPGRLRRASYRILACFVFTCVYFTGVYPGAADSNQRSHFQLLRALAERGTAEIGPEIRDLGTHTDVSVYAGRSYSDKAPGLSVAAIPGYRAMRLFLPMPSSLDDWLVFYGARVLSVTLVVTLALAVFVRRAPSHPLLPLWLFALLFATPFAVYARSFFSHAFVAGLLFLSFALLSRGESRAAAAGAGFLAGAGVASEYPVVVIALCLTALAIARPSRARLSLFAAGAAIPAALLLGYQARYFGGTFHFPATFNQTYPILAHRGVGGISWPSPSAILGLFFDPSHGLLYFSPFLILWPAVAVGSLRRIRRDPPLLATALGPLLLVLLIAGFLPPHWRGGWCLGPRYLVAGFLLVFWLLANRERLANRPAARLLLLAAVVYAAAIVTVCGATYWMIPYSSWNPARTVSAHFLKVGLVEFNLGVAAGLSPRLSLLPPLAAAAIAFFAMLRALPFPKRVLAAATLAGLLAAAAVVAIRPSAAAIENSHRDGLASVLLPSMRPGWR